MSSPIWLTFLLVGLMIALGREFFLRCIFPKSGHCFRLGRFFDKIGTISLFVISMFMLIFPKFWG
ncbi:MAG: hypothetical protein ACLU99_13550 [Alphaproteobacteria bacterium]